MPTTKARPRKRPEKELLPPAKGQYPAQRGEGVLFIPPKAFRFSPASRCAICSSNICRTDSTTILLPVRTKNA